MFYSVSKTEIGENINILIHNQKFNFSGIKFSSDLSGWNLITKLSIASFALIVISGISSLIWTFRVMTVSKVFIFVNYALYIAAQGISFGFLFLIMKSSELLAVFGISGGLFIVMALVGYFSKNLSGMGRYLIFGSLFIFILWIINLIITLTTTVNSDKHRWLSEFIWIGTGLLMLGFIAFDVWRLKRFSAWASASDEDMKFRITAYFGFRLLSDLIALVWVVARMYLRSRR